jgi:IclR family acetate operon transcriptional repressor
MVNSVGAESEGRGGLGTVRNAVRLLELLGEGPAYQQLSDLAERSGMSLPTVHRLLRSLVLADLAVQDPQSSRYGLGPELTRLSGHYLSRLPLLGALAPYLSPLRDELSTTLYVMTLVHGEVVYVDRVDGPGASPYRDTHRVHPALLTAGGRLLAEDREQATRLREEWSAAPWLAVAPSDPTLSAEVAVPVVDGRGVAVAALSAAVDDAEDDGNRAVAASLGRAAKAAGRTLSHV